MFGPNDPNSLPSLLRQHMAPGMIPGPVRPVQLTPGFRAPPSGGAPGMAAPMQGAQGMDPSAMAGLLAAMGRGNSNPANKPPGMPEPNLATGIVDPEATQSAYPGDPANPSAARNGSFLGWLGRATKGLF